MTENTAPAKALIVIESAGKHLPFNAPVNVLDVTVDELTDAGMTKTFARAVTSVALKLYTHGTAELGYGFVATVTGQLGDQSKAA